MANNVKLIRERLLGLSQYELAAKMGCTQGAVSRWESRLIPVDDALALRAMARKAGHPITLEHIYGLEPLKMTRVPPKPRRPTARMILPTAA